MPNPIPLLAASALLAVAASLLPQPWSALCLVAAISGFWRTMVRVRSSLDAMRAQKAALDEQLLQSQKMAAIGEIAAGIAHEINNPLAVITQEAEWLGHLLSQDPPDVAEARKSLDGVRAQVTRCADITHNLLNLARTWKPVSQPASLNRCVEDMARLTEREAAPRRVTLARQYDQNLPMIPLDPPLMRQAVLNLLVNAVQAVPDGGTVTIRTGLSPDSRAYLQVTDNGPGIPREILPRIFDPFFTTKAPGKGTGLGLAITQRIVDRLGGLITAANIPGGGACFTISLPGPKTEKNNE
uniref:histidine kinase n=1 Tax=Fundidesulfovibrio putealis TaxID=270496 RepID=A0A7C4AGS8_9BACT